MSFENRLSMRRHVENAGIGRPIRATTRTLSALLSQLVSYFTSRKDKEEEVVISKPVPITSHRLKLAFRRAGSEPAEELAA